MKQLQENGTGTREHKLEICLDSVTSAVEAERGGADRVELCDNLLEGGTTPSDGTIRVTRERVGIGLQVIIRPRGGDFLYGDDEYAVMRADVERAKELGADGVVFGILTPHGSVDVPRCGALREIAHPMNATFHRAFDVTSDPFAALEAIIDLGFDRILTSGQAPSVWEGLDLVTDLIDRARERIIIMPGGGLNDTNIATFAAKTSAREYHMQIDREVASTVRFRRVVPMGAGLLPPEYTLHVTDYDAVRISRNAIDANHEA